MSRSTLSSDAGDGLVRRRRIAALVVAVWLGAAGVAGAGDVPASSPAAMVGNSPTSQPAQSAAPSTVKAYLELAMQEAAKLGVGNDRTAIYHEISSAQLAAGDIAAAQQMLPRIANANERAFLENQIAATLARQGNFAEARALNERIEVEDIRRSGEAYIALREVLDLVKKGKPEEALQKAQDLEEPRVRMTALCALVERFALDKDTPRARKALDLAIKATSYLEPDERLDATRYVAEAEALAGDVQAARARAGTVAEPRSRDMIYSFIAAAQARTGDAEGADQTMASVGESGGGRTFGYSACAHASIERGDEATARRFVQQATAAYSADPDTQMRYWAVFPAVAAQARLGDTAGAMALTREMGEIHARAMTYGQVARHQTFREGPAAAYAWAQELQSPIERGQAWAGVAMGLVERQKKAEGGSGK